MEADLWGLIRGEADLRLPIQVERSKGADPTGLRRGGLCRWADPRWPIRCGRSELAGLRELIRECRSEIANPR